MVITSRLTQQTDPRRFTFGEDVSFTTASFSGDISLDAALTVDGLLTANAGITADNFTVADTSGNTQIGGTLVVTSTVSQGSQIADFTFNNGSLTSASGTINFDNENLTTNGSATVASLSVSDGNITNVGDISLDTISSDGRLSLFQWMTT